MARTKAGTAATTTATALDPAELRASLKRHNASFDKLLNLLPAHLYLRQPSPEPATLPTTAIVGAGTNGKLTKAQKKAARKEKQINQESIRAAKNDRKREARLARVRPSASSLLVTMHC